MWKRVEPRPPEQPATAASQHAEKQLVVTITAEQLKGGVVSEIAWDGGIAVAERKSGGK